MNTYPAVRTGAPGSAAVASGNAQTTNAAAQILRLGGNAVDAAVAGGFAATVAEPGLTSLAGGGSLLVLLPDMSTQVLDFFTAVPGLGRRRPLPEPATITVVYPSAQQDFQVGPASAAVPGVLAGLLTIHQRYGSLPIADVVAPAWRLATEGARIDSSQAYILQLIEPIARHTVSAERVFAPGGILLQEGDVLVQPELGDFLQHVAHGTVTGIESAAFSEPLLAMAAEGCPITADDLRSYQPTWRVPLRVQTDAWTLLTNPQPAFGGTIVAEALTHLNSDRIVELGHSLADATQKIKSAAFVTQGTTQLSVADSSGMIVSMTTTNGAGGGVLIPGTGIHLNNMLGEPDLIPGGLESLIAGHRLQSMIAPSLVQTSNGTITALGSGGSARIRSAISMVLHQLCFADASLADAVAAPRIHSDDGMSMQVEAGFDTATLTDIRHNFSVNLWDRTDFFFGGVNAVSRAADGHVTAVADHRRNGSVAIIPGV